MQIIEPLDFLRGTLPIVRHHHEHFDGRGYPAGLRDEEIPIGSRIIAIADTYDAITSSRAYRTARRSDEALAEIERCASTQFDPAFVALFTDICRAAGPDGPFACAGAPAEPLTP